MREKKGGSVYIERISRQRKLIYRGKASRWVPYLPLEEAIKRAGL